VKSQSEARELSTLGKLRGPGEEWVVDDQLAFSKDRTISRLTEMQSMEYLMAHAEVHASHLMLALKEVRHWTNNPQPAPGC
jgi:hypothetical protein